MKTDTHSADENKPPRSLLDKHTLFHRINGDKELKDSACRVAGFLMWKMNCRHETCWPGRQTIADALGMSLRTVGDALRSLKDRRWITWRERRKDDGSATSSVYRFVWDRLDEPDDSYPCKSDDRQNMPGYEAGNICQDTQAKSASRIEGRVTGESSSRLSTASPTKDGERSSETPSSSAEQTTRQGRAPAAALLQEGSPEWWKERVWNETGARFKEAFYPTTSGAAFKKRLGELLRRQKWDYPPVDRAMRATIDAEPALDAWEYVTGILRRRSEAGPDYSKPAVVRGVM